MFISVLHTALADDTPCKASLPINTVEKVWCAADQYLISESCIFKYGFERKSKDLGESWLLTSKDINPDTTNACRTLEIKIDKQSGKVIL